MKSNLTGWLLVFGVLSLVVLGCNDLEVETFEKTNVSKVINKPKTNLNWIGHWLHEHDREKMVREVAKEFTIKNPDIALNLKFPQHIRGGRSKRDIVKVYLEMIRTGNYKWDVIWLDDQSYQYVADELEDPDWGQKYLVDFGEVPGFKDTQKSFIFDDPIWAAQTGGIIVGPMLEGYYHAAFYNKEVARKLNIEIKEMGMTFDDFLGYVKAVDEYNLATGAGIVALYESTDWTCQEILFQRLLKSEIGDFTQTLKHGNSEQKREALKTTLHAFEQLGKYSPLIKSHKDNIWFDTRHIPLDGEVLFYVNGIWMYNHWMSIDEEKTRNMIPAELPVFKKVDFYQGGYIPTWAVWKDAPNKEAGIRLLQFWSRPQVAEKWARYTMAPTGVKGQATIGTESDHPFARWQKNITAKYGGDIYYIPSTAYIFGEEGRNALLLDDVKKEILMLLDGETSAEAAYSRIMESVL